MWDGIGMVESLSALPFESYVFIGILVFVFLVCLLFGFWQKSYMTQGPTILTMIGILGTFWGVTEGLIRFDPNNVKDGLPLLLGGLKTAFFASLFGVGFAIVLKLVAPIFGGKLGKNAIVQQGATAGDIVQAIMGLKSTISGEGESTLISQLKLLRQDTNDRLDSLQKAQTDALAQLSQMGSATLVEALQQVIVDFNEKISEQFGDNFKQLNQAVGKLLEWQAQHKDHVDSITKSLASLISQSNTIVENQTQLTSKAESFVGVSQSLSGLLGGLETQKSQLLQTITSLGQVLEKSSSALPELEKRIVQVTEQMASASKQSQELLTASLRDTSTELRKNLEATVSETNRSHSEHSKKIAEHVEKSKEQIELLDAALSAELTKALDAFGRQLVTLSEKFTSDYTPLTERLREVLNIARKSS
jgi:ABC-type transporter Mla subunit MlaD